MMRCIENAVRGGHITREQGQSLQDRVNEMLRHGLAGDEARMRLTEELAKEAKLKKWRAMLQEKRRQVLSEAILSHRNARGENDPAEALWMLLEHHGQAKFDDIETRRLSILSGAHTELVGILNEFRKGWLSGDLRRSQETQVARMDDVVREIFAKAKGVTDDPRARELAEAWLKVAERLRLRGNGAGMSVGKLDYGYMPQAHEPEALLAIKKGPWVEYLMRDGVLDRSKMKSWESGKVLDDEELREALGFVWEKITTDGWIEREASYAQYGKGSLSKRRDDWHRFIHFKDADAFLRYSRDFKSRDPFEAMMGHLSRMSRDIATLEILGPHPDNMRNYLKQLVLRHAAEVRPIQRIIEEGMERIGTTLARVLPGEAGERWSAKLTAGLRDLAELERRIKAGGGDDAGLKDQAKAAAEALDAMERQLEILEPERIGQRRADLTGELARVRDEISGLEADIAAGPAKSTKRGEQRHRGRTAEAERRLDALRAREAAAVDELDVMEQADLSIAREEPEAWQTLIDTIAEIKGETRRIRADGFRAVRDPMNDARKQIATHDAMWDLIRGTHYAPVSGGFSNSMQTFRNIMTAALLGSAQLSALSDMVFQRQARVFAGMDHGMLNIMGGYLSMMKEGNRLDAVEAGLMWDSAIHVMHRQARYVEGFAGSPRAANSIGQWSVAWSGYAADRVIALSGLSWYTQAGKHAFGTAMQSEFGKRVHLRFEELPTVLRTTLDRHGITPKDWEIIRTSGTYNPHQEVQWLRPNEIAQGDGGTELAEKYLSMILRETRFAVPEGTIRSRTVFGSQRPGTIAGEFLRNMGQFKSFGVAVVMLQIGRIVRQFQSGDVKGGLQMSAGLALGGAIAGAIVNELYEIINGRDPVLPTKLAKGELPGALDYWGPAILKAGGLGIYGDFLFAPVNRWGQGLASVIMGPVGGQLERIRSRGLGDAKSWLEGELKEGKTARDAIATARELMPGGTLWYLRLLKERMVFNKLQLAFDPNAEKVFERHEQLQKKRVGNRYWWSAGEAGPERSPMFLPNDRLPVAGASRSQPKAERPAFTQRAPEPGFEVGKRIAAERGKPFEAIDGDTIQHAGKRFRIIGHDAPEVFERAKSTGERVAGVKAAVRLNELLKAGRAEIEIVDTPDVWGRGRARVRVDGRDVSDILIGEGLAAKPKPYKGKRQ